MKYRLGTGEPTGRRGPDVQGDGTEHRKYQFRGFGGAGYRPGRVYRSAAAQSVRARQERFDTMAVWP